MLVLFILSFIVSILPASEKQNIEICISGLKSGERALMIGIFSNQEEFLNEKPLVASSVRKSVLKDSIIHINVKLSKGEYGVSVLDDENGDGKMNYRVIGIPKEGFGFSGYFHKVLKRPAFKDFCFQVNSCPLTIYVKMRYFP